MPDGFSREISEWIAKPTNFLVVSGEPGTGKTFLCSALVELMISKFSSMRAYSERALLRKIRNSFDENAKGDYLDYLHQLLDDQLIILDDIGSSGHTDWREEILMEAVDYRYEAMLPTVFTTNLSKEEVYGVYGKRIGSRLFAKENTVIILEDMPDLRQMGK